MAFDQTLEIKFRNFRDEEIATRFGGELRPEHREDWMMLVYIPTSFAKLEPGIVLESIRGTHWKVNSSGPQYAINRAIFTPVRLTEHGGHFAGDDVSSEDVAAVASASGTGGSGPNTGPWNPGNYLMSRA